MDTNVKLHLGRFKKYLWEEADLMIVIGDFPDFLVGKKLYEERHKITGVIKDSEETLNKLMAAASFVAISLAERESWGWSVTMEGSPYGYFIGAEPEGMVCGVSKESDQELSTIYVQRQKNDGPMTQSHLVPIPGDPVKSVESYFIHADQTRTRIELDENNSGVLVQLMPAGTFDEIEKMPADKLIELCRQKAEGGEFKLIEEVVTFYECRCDDEQIYDMILSLPKDQRKELWGDQSEINIECPRCGRDYKMCRMG